jgi:predicted HD phosphohydrolase
MAQIQQVGFTAFTDATAEEWAVIRAYDAERATHDADRVLGWLRQMDGPSPYPVSRLEHSLQSATRAEADGADEEMILVALLHDIGDEIAPLNHSQVAAAVLRPYVSDKARWIVHHHGLFQGYYWFEFFDRDKNERDRYADSPYYDACIQFCADWDQNCFDPSYPTKPLGHFEPLVRELFSREPGSCD